MKQGQEHWAIVGGGLLGLTLALRLTEAGRQVTVIEADDHLGGLAAPWELTDVVCDRHYHVVLLSDSWTRSMLAELGLEQDVEWAETRTGFFTDGRLHSMSSALEFLRFPPLDFVSKMRLAGTIFCASKLKDWQLLETVTAEDWLRRWSGSSTFEKIWLPLLRAKLGENASRASAVFIWSTIARMYAARRTGLKKELFGFIPGGYGRVLDRLEAALRSRGVRIVLQQRVRSVQNVGTAVAVESTDGWAQEFDQVAVTVPCPQAASICAGLSADEQQRLKGVLYQGIVCMALLLKRPLADFYVTNITDPGMPFTGVIEMSALADRRHFGGASLVYLPRYVPQDDSALSHSDEDMEDSFLSGLERMYPQFSRQDVICRRISRVPCGVPILTLNYSQTLPPMHTSVPGVHIVNSARIVQGTQNVNEILALAHQAAGRLLSARQEAEHVAA